jgi:hypothetical protein
MQPKLGGPVQDWHRIDASARCRAMPPRRSLPTSSLLVLFLLCAPTSGCCSLARLFCGPDTSPWISVDYTTPERSVRTLLEALRRDDPQVVYDCLSNRYRDELQIDSGTTQLAWPKLREQNPGLHVAGYAEVPASTRLADDHARITLDIEGHALVVDLVRQRSWQVHWQRAGGPPFAKGAAIPTFATVAQGNSTDDGRVQLQITLDVKSSAAPDELLRDLQRAGIVAEWKVDRLAMPAAR